MWLYFQNTLDESWNPLDSYTNVTFWCETKKRTTIIKKPWRQSECKSFCYWSFFFAFIDWLSHDWSWMTGFHGNTPFSPQNRPHLLSYYGGLHLSVKRALLPSHIDPAEIPHLSGCFIFSEWLVVSMHFFSFHGWNFISKSYCFLPLMSTFLIPFISIVKQKIKYKIHWKKCKKIAVSTSVFKLLSESRVLAESLLQSLDMRSLMMLLWSAPSLQFFCWVTKNGESQNVVLWLLDYNYVCKSDFSIFGECPT